MPNGKASPGLLVLVSILTTPERSVAVGSTQKAVAELTPSSTLIEISVGQLLMVGLVVSSV